MLTKSVEWEPILYKGYTIKIVQDEDPPNPRDNDNLGIMVCFHKRYSLGDKTELRSDLFNGWTELQEYLVSKLRAKVVLPLYMLDHSGITISTQSFNDPWDSGQIGFIYTTSKRMNEFLGKPRTRVDRLARDAKARGLLIGEVETYDAYVRGDCWGYIIEDINGVHLDSCWGYYDADYAMKEAEKHIDHLPMPAPVKAVEETNECEWTIDDDGDTFMTSCGESFDVLDRNGLPEGFKFCMYCGKPIKEHTE